MQYILQGNVVPKKNSKNVVRRGNRIFVLSSKRFMEWHKKAVAEITEQGVEETIDTPCHIDIVLYHSDKRRRDSDNAVASIFDLLVDTKILADDSTKYIRSFSVKNKTAKKSFAVIDIYKMEWLNDK